MSLKVQYNKLMIDSSLCFISVHTLNYSSALKSFFFSFMQHTKFFFLYTHLLLCLFFQNSLINFACFKFKISVKTKIEKKFYFQHDGNVRMVTKEIILWGISSRNFWKSVRKMCAAVWTVSRFSSLF